MPVFDASSILLAWDTYPENQFPPFWNWICDEIANTRILMSAVAFAEVGHKAPDCEAWLSNCGLQPLPVTNDIVQEANNLKNLLGVVNDNYHVDGVDENDLFIIATAKVHGLDLVSDENQPTAPVNLLRSKIPTVCRMNNINVSCVKLNNYIRGSGTVFR
jgi:hypothetical protein